MKIDILTLFPDMFAPLEHSIVGKAKDKGLLEINYHNFRENAEKARHVDDEPYGGGQGMLLRAQPIFDAFDAIEKKNPRVILLDPAGSAARRRHADPTANRPMRSYTFHRQRRCELPYPPASAGAASERSSSD